MTDARPIPPSPVSSQPAFFGRQPELTQFKTELRNPRGAAILVIGQQGMGKTMLLDRFIAVANDIDGLTCGAVREEVTRTDSVESILAIFMDRAYQAANMEEGSFEGTPRRLEQWRALLNVLQIGDLVMSLRRDPISNAREQFLAAIDRIADKLPDKGRAVFIIDPEKYLPKDSDDDWAIVIKRLPEKIKLVFAQRPEDSLAQSHTVKALPNIVRIPNDELDVLDAQGFDALINTRASETGQTPEALRQILEPYHLHPYAVVAAIDLLATGVPPSELPPDPTPENIAAAQWERIQRGGQSESNGELAIRLFESFALLEVAVPDEIVEAVSNLTSAQRKSLTADRFLGPLIRDEGGTKRIYHAILSDHIRAQIAPDDMETYHRRAIEVYRKRLHEPPPDGLPARRLAVHVRAVDDDEAFVHCFVDECTPRLLQLGLLEDIETLTAEALPTVPPNGADSAALLGNLGIVYSARSDLDEAERMHRMALEIEEKLGRHESMATNYGNLGIIMRIRGDLNEAERMLSKALKINQKLGRLEGMARDYGNLGTVFFNRHDLDESEKMHRKALEINQKLGRLEGMAIQYGNLGNVNFTRSTLNEAEKMYRKALEANEQLGRIEGMAIQYGNIGNIAAQRGDHDEAEMMYRKALEVSEPTGMLEISANQFSNLGSVAKQRGEIAEARRLWKKSRDLFAQLGAQHQAQKVQGWLDKLPAE